MSGIGTLPKTSPSYFKIHPEYPAYNAAQPALRRITEKMREEILASLPKGKRAAWELNEWCVPIQWSDGAEGLQCHHVHYAHRNHVVATLALEGAGTIAKLPERDLSRLDYKQVHSIVAIDE